MTYPSDKADFLETYVRQRFPLRGPPLHIYAGLRWMERKKSGFCRPVYINQRDIADISGINVKSVKPSLAEMMELGVIDWKNGTPIKGGKIATMIRRKTLAELQARLALGDDDACRLARALSGRSFVFEGDTVKPTWTPAHTGRVCSSNPNVQGKPSAARLAGLRAGLRQGQVLVHADIRQAEPTLIKHLLHIPVDRDLYAEYMAVMGCPKPDAKKAINTLAYCKATLAVFAHWPEAAQAALRDYVEPLAEYKAKLFAASRRTRSVTTLTGRTINAGKGVRLHPGTIMNWRIQGTVADVVNAACLRLLDCASVLVPLHDAVYAVVPTDQAATVEASITDKAREVGLPLTVKPEVYHAC